MTDLVVHPQAAPLVGRVPVPSDKSIGHRALLVAALSVEPSELRMSGIGDDNRRTLAGLRAMGIGIEEALDEATRETLFRVRGRGLYGLSAPSEPLDCGNSGTTMRLFAGLLAGQSFGSTLVGDASLSARPMGRIVEPLTKRGARIRGAERPGQRGGRDVTTAPLAIAPLEEGSYLGPLDWESPVPSAQIKSALLLSGLFAHGPTLIREAHVSRDHTERMLAAVGAPIEGMAGLVALDPAGWNGRLAGLTGRVPGDLSAAAFLLAAAALVPGSSVVVRDVGLNPTRAGFLEILRDMGGRLVVEPHGETLHEPVGDVAVQSGELRGAAVGGELLVRSIDEVPILAALGARAAGETRIREAAELRVKESDRIHAMATTLRAFGVAVAEETDGLTVAGQAGPLQACEIDARGDHRIAMAAAVLGLVAAGPTRIRDVDAIATSFPRFVGTLRALGARIEVE